MSTLTEEQRKRIEENRRKALEKRAAKAQAINGSKPFASSYQPNQPPPLPSGACGLTTVPKQSTLANSVSGKSNVVEHSHPVAGKNYNPSPISSLLGSKKVHDFFKSKDREVRGTCILLTRKRFFVDISYNKKVIDIFKTVPSRQYDMQTKRWNFAIEDHDKLMSLLKPLQPDILIAPLPQLMLKIFINASDKSIIENHDLSSLDPVILEALLPFQREGVNFGIQHNGRILLADDMGLGKTIQAIAIANYYKNDWPLLVVTPSSVRYSWVEAFHTWLPSVSQQDVTVINSSKDHIPNDKVILMSYDLLTKMKDAVEKRNFKSVIMDESHFLKNPKSARTKAAQAVMKNMKRILMLTGTPALSRPIELFTQLNALSPKYFPSSINYGIRYCNGKQMPWGWDFSGSSNMEELHLLLKEVVMIRRLKSEVIKQLPSKCRQMIVLDPSRVSTRSKVLKALSNKMRQKNLTGMEKRGALLEYFHETGAVKTPAVCEYISDLLEADRKFICFAHHKSVLDSICESVEKRKVDYIRIDGSTSAEQKKKLCDKFQLNDSCKVAALSITTANCGITLTAASLVVFAELFWNPGILTQAEDRAHRIGQEDSVVVQYLVAKGTADDEIWPLVQRKLDVLNKAGLSKDNFKTADTVLKEDSDQLLLDDFLGELDCAVVDSSFFDENTNVPEKRLKTENNS